MTVCLNWVVKMIVCLNFKNLKYYANSKRQLYKYTDKFITVFSLVDASSGFNQKRLGNYL